MSKFTDLTEPKTLVGSTVSLASPSSDTTISQQDITAVVSTLPADEDAVFALPVIGPVRSIASTINIGVQSDGALGTPPQFAIYGIDHNGRMIPLLNRDGDHVVTVDQTQVEVEGGKFRTQFDPNKLAIDMKGCPYLYLRPDVAAAGTNPELFFWIM